MAYEYVLTALADPTRRAIFTRLRRRPHTVGELARLARLKQPTVSQHLRALRRARLVDDRRDGTRRYYSATPEGLAALKTYVESMWDAVLRAYAAPAGTAKRPARRGRRTPSS